MTKHTLSLHLTDARKNRLDALIAHSEYEGHGAQSEFLRALIDETAADHSEIDFENPEASIDDEQWKYHPLTFEGLLTQDQVREILNTEKAPAINPGHCPPTWKPRDKSDKAILMAAYYRYYEYMNRLDEKKHFDQAVEDVTGKTSAGKVNEYQDRIKKVLKRYGDKPSNIVIVGDLIVKEWLDNMNQLSDKRDVPDNYLTQYIQQGKEFKQELDELEEDELLSEVESILDKLKQQKEES